MSSALDQIREIVTRDLDPDFVSSLCTAMPWEYHLLYERLAGEPHLPEEYRNELFKRQMGSCATKAIAQAAQTHRIPFEFRRLDCNGQSKLLLKSGRVMLIQEPMTSISDHPRTSEYKRQLANTHGLVRQLELDLGDQPHRIYDWSGCVLCALLHGSAGSRFTRDDKMLGGLMLAAPNAAYESWVLRLDLHRLAMFGVEKSGSTAGYDEAAPAQPDDVRVTLKAKKANREAG